MNHGILINGSTFWVVHRSRVHGPFDYEWSHDFCGVEFLYQGQKFGEYCSSEELYADLTEFALPQSVYEVASIVIATVVKSILDGSGEENRPRLIEAQLRELGYGQFASIDFVELSR